MAKKAKAAKKTGGRRATPKSAKKVTRKVAKKAGRKTAKAVSVARRATKTPRATKVSKRGATARKTTTGGPAPVSKKTAGRRSGKSAALPLSGLAVLEVGGATAAAAAGAVLANFGARVVKVEPAVHGDPERFAEPLVGGLGAVFSMFNRGKQSVALDAVSRKGKSAYLALAARSDVVIDGAGYRVLDRAGIGYKVLSKTNDRLVYAAVTGFGQSGPYAPRAGSEINHLAAAGALELFGGPSLWPALPGLSLGSVSAGALPAVVGILLALEVRRSSGKGQLVDAAILDGLAGVMAHSLAEYSASRKKPRYGKGRLYGELACYQLYPARGGHWLAVGALDRSSWTNLCRLLKREDLVQDQYADEDRQQVLIAELTRIFQRKEVSVWMETFEGHDVCVTPVEGPSGAAHNEHLIDRGAIVPIKSPVGAFAQVGVYPKLSQTPGVLRPTAPQLGEHTRAVLEDAGLSKKVVDGLIKSKVASTAD